MRVFELARQLGIKSAAVLAAVEQAGVDAGRVDHASDKLRPEDEAALRSFLAPAADAVAEPEASESEVPRDGEAAAVITADAGAGSAEYGAGASAYVLVGCSGVGWEGGRVLAGETVPADVLDELPAAWQGWFAPVTG